MLAVLVGAALHASWNALVRAGADKMLDTVLVVCGAGLLTAVLLPFFSPPAPESYPYLGASALIHVAYFTFVALSYHEAELSFAYPIMRGAAPALSAAAAALLLNESPSLGAWVGILLVSGGILLLSRDSLGAGAFRATPALMALGNAGIIVVYTLIDGVGARLSGHPLSYTGWIFLLTAVLLLSISCLRSGRGVLAHARRNWLKGIGGGACTLASYGLALWAMTLAPIALVAALRETSVVFAAVIAVFALNEQLSHARYLSIIAVCAGAVAIKLF
jgi:drug/metabolite transporter (DMT)-like permease